MELSARQFGLLIAYVLPGLIALSGVAPIVPAVAVWFHGSGEPQPTLAASLYVVLASLASGMTASCFRWLLLDSLLHRTGLHPPDWDDTRLAERLDAFDYLVENHYRYYQFYGNALLCCLFSYAVQRTLETSPRLGVGTDLAVVILALVLFAGSRDALAKYYRRTERLIGSVAEKGSTGVVMTNGNHVAETAGAANEAPAAKPHAAKHREARPKPHEDAKGKEATKAVK